MMMMMMMMMMCYKPRPVGPYGMVSEWSLVLTPISLLPHTAARPPHSFPPAQPVSAGAAAVPTAVRPVVPVVGLTPAQVDARPRSMRVQLHT
jgi:hypothetical protein